MPDSWIWGNCVVTIDVSGADVRETATFAAIFKRAFDLMVDCVIREPHLGGVSKLGVDDGLEVFIYGLY